MAPRKKQEEGKPTRSFDLFWGSMIGAMGAAVVAGLLAGPRELYYWVTRPADFPENAVLFTTSPDCGKGRWEKLPGAEGRVIMAAGPAFKTGEQVPGRFKVKLKPENIPSMGVSVIYTPKKGNFWGGDTPYVQDVVGPGGDGQKQEVARIGRFNNDEIDLTPPGFALTVCRRKD